MAEQHVLVEEGSTLHQIHQLVNKLETVEELHIVFQMYKGAVDRIRSNEAMRVKLMIPVGAKVYWDSRKHGGRFVGKLTAKKRTRGVVNVDGHIWTVPLSMLKRAEDLKGEKE